MGTYYFSTTSKSPGGDTMYTSLTTSQYTYRVTADKPGTPGDEKGLVEARLAETRAAAEAKMKAEVETQVRMGGGMAVSTAGPNADVIKAAKMREKAATESLGKRTIEGVTAEGTRSVSTIEAGAIGNDRPIQSVTERWFSPDLQTVMLVRSTDPRAGEDSFKLVNVNRSEPAAYLFQVPSGYQIVEQK
jgi:hypothetical protein